MATYRLNSPDVIQETVDGEALIIHTPSGIYYSLEGTGEQLWNSLLAGHTVEEIAGAYAGDDGLAPATLVTAIADFTQLLLDKELIAPRDEAANAGTAPAAPEPFSPPVLQAYNDMQELLLVDPIHEVDPLAGWPQRAEPN